VNSNHQHPPRRRLGDVIFAVVVGRLVGAFSGLWRFQRFIGRLIGLGLALMVASFILPGLVFTLLSTAALWPVYVGGVFALWARRGGDRVGLKVYAERVSAAVAANRELVTKGVVLAAIAGLSCGVSALTTSGAGPWRALDLAVGVSGSLVVVAVCALERIARARTSAASAPRPRQSYVPDQPNRQRARLDAPGPRSSLNRTAGPR